MEPFEASVHFLKQRLQWLLRLSIAVEQAASQRPKAVHHAHFPLLESAAAAIGPLSKFRGNGRLSCHCQECGQLNRCHIQAVPIGVEVAASAGHFTDRTDLADLLLDPGI